MILSQPSHLPQAVTAPAKGGVQAVPLIEDGASFLQAWSEHPAESDEPDVLPELDTDAEVLAADADLLDSEIVIATLDAPTIHDGVETGPLQNGSDMTMQLEESIETVSSDSVPAPTPDGKGVADESAKLDQFPKSSAAKNETTSSLGSHPFTTAPIEENAPSTSNSALTSDIVEKGGSQPEPPLRSYSADTTIATPATSQTVVSTTPTFVQNNPLAFMQASEQDTALSAAPDGTSELGGTTSTTTPQTAIGSSVAGGVKTATPTVVQQIAAALAQSSGQNTQIALNPEELGRVRISLSSTEAGLVVNIVAERPETADLMRRNIDSLLQDFSDLGYDNPTFDFHGNGENEQENSSGASSESPDGSSADVTLSHPAALASGYTALGGLDLKL